MNSQPQRFRAQPLPPPPPARRSSWANDNILVFSFLRTDGTGCNHSLSDTACFTSLGLHNWIIISFLEAPSDQHSDDFCSSTETSNQLECWQYGSRCICQPQLHAPCITLYAGYAPNWTGQGKQSRALLSKSIMSSRMRYNMVLHLAMPTSICHQDCKTIALKCTLQLLLLHMADVQLQRTKHLFLFQAPYWPLGCQFQNIGPLGIVS